MQTTLDLIELESNADNNTNKSYDIPLIIKYMGSKKPIIDFVVRNILEIHDKTKPLCDLFSGSCSVSAALRRKYDFISNDVQEYSKIIALTYFSDLSKCDVNETLEEILYNTKVHVENFKNKYPELWIDYSTIKDLNTFYFTEEMQRALLQDSFEDLDYNLFVKYYSGTYWSFEQCAWIDGLRKTAERYINSPLYNAILSSIMYAMSYTTQSTGHFAQYRDGTSDEAMFNILFYKQKNLFDLFKKKFVELLGSLNNSIKTVVATTLDYKQCLKEMPSAITVYADPPYAPVHYSRFYHALETLVKYDYPEIEFKGRYRKDRHQSPFSQKSNATRAFSELFEGIVAKKSQMVLSYSNAGVLDIDSIFALAQKYFPKKSYILQYHEFDHVHSSMGRVEDSRKEVVEHLIVAKKK